MDRTQRAFLSAGACGFPVDPDAADEVVVWRPELLASLVILVPASSPDSAAVVFAPHTWPGRLTRRDAEDGIHLILTGERDHHLWMPTPATPDTILAVELGFGPMMESRAAAALRFRAALQGGTGPPDRAPLSPQQRDRLVRALRAHDGTQDGASQRDIAYVLWGKARVQAEFWPHSSLRSATVRLLDTARTFIRGAYLRLLGRG